MKRLIAAGIILLLIITVCFTEGYITNSFETEMTVFISEIKSTRNADDAEASNRVIEGMKATFEKTENILSVFTDKRTVDDIERSIYRLSDYNYSEDKAMFLSELSVLETEIKELRRSSGVFYFSVF